MKIDNSEHDSQTATIVEQMDFTLMSAVGGGFAAAKPAPTRKTIIRKKKRAVSFERRFLSARGKTNNQCLEVAVVWRDTVLSITQYKAEPGSVITVGSSKDCNYHVETNIKGGEKIHLAQYVNNHWEILFNNAFEGFILQAEKKTEFKSASTAEFAIPNTSSNLMPGSLACAVDGQVRAKFIFGEVSILIHYVDAVALPKALGGFKMTNYAPLVASIVLHLAVFSVILFSTNNVSALMVDRIISSSRFVDVVEQAQDEIIPEKPDEVKPPEIEETISEVVDVGKESPILAPTVSDKVGSGNGDGMSSAESAARGAGLLNQANAMNSMLAAGINLNDLDNMEWSVFDSNIAATASNYGLTATGTAGGSSGWGVMGSGGFGEEGAGGHGQSIARKGHDFKPANEPKKQGEIHFKPQPAKVNGSLDPRLIRKVVRDHEGQLRACYERELSKTRGLNGRIVVAWVITPQGSVSSAIVKETTMKNKNVEACLTNAIKFWRFQSPKGGGSVLVEYPFVFEIGTN